MSKDSQQPRKVPVFSTAKTITAYDINGNESAVGTLATRLYEGESVFRHDYLSGNESDYKQLKPTKSEWSPLNHTEVLDPLLDDGWEVKQTTLSRQGRRLGVLMTHPKGQTFNDPFKFDKGMFGGVSGSDNGLEEMIVIKNSVDPGKGVSYEKGFYRFICTNGLVDKAIQLARITMNSTNFDPAEVMSELSSIQLDDDMIMGMKIGNEKGLNRFNDWFGTWLEQHEDRERMTRSLPPIAQNLVKPLNKFPNWALAQTQPMMKSLALGGRKNVFSGQIVNALTGAVNLGLREDETRSRASVENKLSRVTNSINDLVGVFSL